MRLYQETIVGSASNQNTLVVLPTGLGKTIIAALVAAFRLEKYPNSKIIILAPTRPLVEQHMKVFQSILNIPSNQFEILTGSIPPRMRSIKWDEAQLLCLTPQVLENDLITGRYSLDNVAMIVFDEAHRAVGNYAYTFIAEEYQKTANTPLIMGLTASPGSHESKIREVAKNLHITNVEIRTDQSKDVRSYIQPVKVEYRKIKLPPYILQIKSLLEKSLKNKINILKDAGTLIQKHPRYVSRVDLLKCQGTIRVEIGKYKDPPMELFGAASACAAAIRISHAIELLETQGLHSLHEFFGRLEKGSKRSGASKAVQRLLGEPNIIKAWAITREAISKGRKHPKTKEAIKLVQAQLSQEPNSRILMFTQYRDTASHLVKNLSGYEQIRPELFIGQAKRDNTKGLTQKEQVALLDRFRDGDLNVLVATQVAEEGLDIPECDMVVFYDSVPSGVRFIQRRGRTGRRSAGKIIILVAQGTRDEAYYWSAVHKERAMKRVLTKKSLNQPAPPENSIDTSQTQLDSFQEASSTKSKKSTQSPQITIIVDNREFASPIVKNLVRLGIKIEKAQLPVGDYIVSEDTVIERKKVEDFISSLLDGRLFEQCKALRDNQAIHGAVVSIILGWKIPILMARDSEEVAMYLASFAKREQVESRKNIRVRGQKEQDLLSKIQEFVVAGIPGINNVLARRLLERFETIENIFLATEEDLLSVKGVGKTKAVRIKEVITAKYTP
jgi:Fanconi anemia group M protein